MSKSFSYFKTLAQKRKINYVSKTLRQLHILEDILLKAKNCRLCNEKIHKKYQFCGYCLNNYQEEIWSLKNKVKNKSKEEQNAYYRQQKGYYV